MKTTDQKIAEALAKLELIGKRRARLDSFEKRVKRQLRSLKAAAARKAKAGAVAPEPPAPTPAYVVVPSPPVAAVIAVMPPPAPPSKVAARERFFADLLVEMQGLAEGFADRLGVLRPTVRYTNTRGACKNIRATAHMHCKGKRRGLMCVSKAHVEAYVKDRPDKEPRRLMAHEVCHLRAGRKRQLRGHCIEFYQLMTELLGDGGEGARAEWQYKKLAERLGYDPLTRQAIEVPLDPIHAIDQAVGDWIAAGGDKASRVVNGITIRSGG